MILALVVSALCTAPAIDVAVQLPIVEPRPELRFVPGYIIGPYYKMFRGDEPVPYPEEEPPRGEGCTLLTITVEADGVTSDMEYATLTLIDPTGRKLFMVDMIYGRERNLFIFSALDGVYIAHITSEQFGQVDYLFSVSVGEEVVTGPIWLRKLP